MERAVAGIDVGGTFTDVVAVDDAGRVRHGKVPTDTDDQSAGLWHALLEVDAGDSRGAVAHGTTTATNAVLEGVLARTALVVTAGFGDLLELARQDRPALYDLSVTRPAPPVPRHRVVEVPERIAADGTVLEPLGDAAVDAAVAAVRALDPEAVAVSLVFAWRHGDHERRLVAALREALPDVPVTSSIELLPQAREYERTLTCALNAAVAPVMARYLARIQERVGDRRVTVMTSGGGTARLADVVAKPVHTLLSGPAAGVVAAARVAAASGHPDALAFDMGGTSTDVCLILDGAPLVEAETLIGGWPLLTPAVGVHTIGAGGGSIAWVDEGGALRVGPRSAGARPGPACYGLGGTAPTVTDAHVRLGHLGPRGLGGGRVRLDVDAAATALGHHDPADVLMVVRAAMTRALRRVSTERGVDPAGLALVAYGGAGPLHACALAHELGCRTVLVPSTPGVLSALGLLLAPRRVEVTRTVHSALVDDVDSVWEELEAAARRELADGSLQRLGDVRTAGQRWTLRVPLEPGADHAAVFLEAHRRAYGFEPPPDELRLDTLRVVATAAPLLAEAPPPATGEPQPRTRRRADLGDGWIDVEVVDRAALPPGSELAGPLIIEQDDSTVLLSARDHGLARDDGVLEVTVG